MQPFNASYDVSITLSNDGIVKSNSIAYTYTLRAENEWSLDIDDTILPTSDHNDTEAEVDEYQYSYIEDISQLNVTVSDDRFVVELVSSELITLRYTGDGNIDQLSLYHCL